MDIVRRVRGLKLLASTLDVLLKKMEKEKEKEEEERERKKNVNEKEKRESKKNKLVDSSARMLSFAIAVCYKLENL